MALIARFVLGIVGDVVFDVAASRIRAHESEIDRYFDERGFRRPPPASTQRTK